MSWIRMQGSYRTAKEVTAKKEFLEKRGITTKIGVSHIYSTGAIRKKIPVYKLDRWKD